MNTRILTILAYFALMTRQGVAEEDSSWDVTNTLSSVSSWWSTVEPQAEEIFAAGSIGIHALEQGFGNVTRWTRRHRRSVRAAASAALLLHGGRFSHSILLLQTVKVTAGPTIGRAARELAQTYSSVRAEAKKQAPALENAKQVLQDYAVEIQELKKEATEIQSLAKSGEITKDVLESKMLELKNRHAEIVEHSEKLNSVLSSVSAVASAVDLEHVKDLATGVLTACATCLATVSSKTAASVTIGFDIGNQVVGKFLREIAIPFADRLAGSAHAQFSNLPGPVRRWAEAGLASAASFAGVLAAFFLKQQALVLSACSLGSRGILDAINDASTHFSGKALVLPESPQFAGLHMGLTFFGFFSQLRGGGKLHPIFEFLLKPLTMIEAALRALSARAMRA